MQGLASVLVDDDGHLLVCLLMMMVNWSSIGLFVVDDGHLLVCLFSSLSRACTRTLDHWRPKVAQLSTKPEPTEQKAQLQL